MFHTQIEPAATPQESRRRAPRLSVEAEVGLRALGQTGVEARLVNLSSLGFMAECDLDVGAGSRVWVNLPGVGRANALIVWVRGGRIGGEFAEAIDPLAVLQALGLRSN